MKRNKKNKSWSALFTGAVMLIAGMPAMAGEAGTFQNGISLANGYVELEAPVHTDWRRTRPTPLRMRENWLGLCVTFIWGIWKRRMSV